REWTKKYPEWNEYIINSFMSHYTDLSQKINELTFESLECRIIKLLKQEEKLLGSKKVYITHQAIAEKLGTSRVVVSRILKKVEIENQIILSRGYIELNSKLVG
ncbi:MAG: helix-turn-helix domain-containing protein, partial [Bacteroidetes bacterium]|nr:helix-turn-helix domain-containing protein [Bacteroidota bacterium]